MDKRPTITMLVGIPSVGKTTYAYKNYKNVVSSDAIREELGLTTHNKEDNEIVFNEVHRRLREYLKNGEDCCFDATNVVSKNRKAFLKYISDIDCHKECICFLFTPEQALELQKNRERKVPARIIKHMWKCFQKPQMSEGWDELKIIQNYL